VVGGNPGFWDIDANGAPHYLRLRELLIVGISVLPTIYHLDPRNSRTPELWKSGTPGLRKSGTPALQNSGTPEVRNSGTPEVRNSGAPELRNSGSPELRSSGSPELWHLQNSGSPEVRNSGTPEVRSPGAPELRSSGEYLGLLGLPGAISDYGSSWLAFKHSLDISKNPSGASAVWGT